MAKENKNTAKITFNDERILGEQQQFKTACERLNAWLDDMGKKTLSAAFSGGREGMPFSALNLGILSLIGQGGIRERWLKTCSENGRENVNIGDFILANMVQETEEEKKARIERETKIAALTAAAEAFENAFEMALDHLPSVTEIESKKAKIADAELFTILLERACKREDESENA